MSRTRKVAVELFATVGWPAIILIGFSDRLGATLALCVAIAGPLLHGIFTVATTGAPRPLHVVSLISVVLSGGIGLVGADTRWFALKEGLVPSLLGAAAFASTWSPWPVVRELLREIIDAERLDGLARERGTTGDVDYALRRANGLFGAVLAASGLASAIVASFMVTSPSGSVEYAQEVGKYTMTTLLAITGPVVVAQIFVLRSVMNAIEAATGVEFEALMAAEKP